MRKLKLQVQLSVDGFNASKDGQLDWMIWNWDNKLNEYTRELTESVDTILLGRNMTEGFISHWTKVYSNPEDPEYEFGKIMIDTPKVVFTKTLESSSWPNTVLAKGNLADEINNLKKTEGRDIIVYGGSSFVSSLIKEGLIDDYRLYIHPVLLGDGMTIFRDLQSRQELTLIKSTAFRCGVTVLHYGLKTKK